MCAVWNLRGRVGGGTVHILRDGIATDPIQRPESPAPEKSQTAVGKQGKSETDPQDKDNRNAFEGRELRGVSSCPVNRWPRHGLNNLYLARIGKKKKRKKIG